jgi:Tol biopolymer transport system component
MKNCFLLITILFFLSLKVSADINPLIDWKKISTAHFEIIYDAKHYELARAYALRAEYIYSVLSPHLSDTPEKTVVIINDSTDMANGYATRIPYPHIMLYPVMPSSIDTISEFGDWAYELLLHEYMHILTFEPAHGIVAPFRSIFGTIITPNMLLPRWWLEGIAVEYETRFSKKGRLRSVIQDSSLRSIELNDAYEKYDISEINESDISSWPRGARPYLFGSLVMSEIAHNKGTAAINTLMQEQGSRIPYMIEGPIISLTELNYTDWFNQAILNTQIKVQKQLKQLRTKPTTQLQAIKIKGLENHTPTISPNGQYLALINKNIYGKNSVKIYDRKDENRSFDLIKDELAEVFQGKDQVKGTQKDAPPGGYITRISWLPDSSGFAFDKTVPTDSYNNFSDIFIYDFNTKKTHNLTKAVRAREPDVSPDGLNVAFIHTEGGVTALGVTSVRKLNDDEEFKNDYKIIFTPPLQHRLSYPTFLNNDEILFSWRDTEGNQNFYKISFKSKDPEPQKINLNKLTDVGFTDRTSIGILFAANENGTSNVYLADPSFKDIQRLTHVETAAFESTLDLRTNELYTTLITNEGPKTFTAPIKKESLSIELPKITAIHADRYPQKEADAHLKTENLEKDFAANLKEPAEYSSWPYILPHYWFPFFYASGEGYGTQISTASQDPLNFHNYLLQVGYDSYNSQTTGAFSYTNRATTWPVVFQSMVSQSKDPIFKTDINQKLLKVMVTKDLKPWSDNLSWALGASTQSFHISRGSATKSGPELALSYQNLTTSQYSPVPIGGWSSALAFSHFPKDKVTRYGFDRTLVEGSYYHTKSLPENHVTFLRYKGQYINDFIPVVDYTSSETTPLTNSLLGSGFVLRGYDTNYLVFKSALNTTLEYGFLLSSKLYGAGTTPLLIKKIRLHFFIDSMVAEGHEFDATTEKYNQIHASKTFLSYGSELKFDTTLGYYFPISWVVGLYDRPQYSGKTKPILFFSIQI